MATLKVLVKLSSDDNTPPFEIAGIQQSITQGNPGGGNPGKVALTTSESVISFSGLTALGWCIITNTGTTNNARFGPESGGALVPCIEIRPGETQIVRLIAGVTYRAVAITAATTIDIRCFEN